MCDFKNNRVGAELLFVSGVQMRNHSGSREQVIFSIFL